MQLTLEPGARVAEVARAQGVNANQVFKWRKEFERGELTDACAALIPVTVSGSSESAGDAKQVAQRSSGGAIHSLLMASTSRVREMNIVMSKPVGDQNAAVGTGSLAGLTRDLLCRLTRIRIITDESAHIRLSEHD